MSLRLVCAALLGASFVCSASAGEQAASTTSLQSHQLRPDQPSGCNTFPLVMPDPVKGAPYSLKRSITNSHTVNNQTTITDAREERYARDSMGRERTELGLYKDGAFFRLWMTVRDPVAGTQADFFGPPKKVLMKHLPAPKPGEKAEEPHLESLYKETNVEQLGTRTIAGVNAVGTRHTAVSHDGANVEQREVTERWFSPELKIDMSVTREDLSMNEGTTKLLVSDLSRVEPESALFKVPDGYSIYDCPAE